MLNQNSSKNTNENKNPTSDRSLNASLKPVTPPSTLPSPTNLDVEIANSTSSGVLTPPLAAAQRNNVIFPTCIGLHEATTLQLNTMSQFSSLLTEGKKFQAAIIKVHEGEDVAEKIKIFAKQNEFVWIAGAIGSLYEAEIGQEQKDLILQGDYDIINLGGLFTAPKNGNPMTGQLSITIAAAGIGRVYGGAVLGPLIAQSVVQITAFIWNSVEDGSEEQDNDI